MVCDRGRKRRVSWAGEWYQRFQLSVCSSGRRREEGRDQRGGLIQSSQVEIVATNSDTTIWEASSVVFTWIILVTISWTAALIAVMLPDIAITLSFVVGKNSPFWETFIFAPVAWFNWLITDPPRPIIDPAIADGQRSFRRWSPSVVGGSVESRRAAGNSSRLFVSVFD